MSITPPTPAVYDLLSPPSPTYGYWLDSTTDDQDIFPLPTTTKPNTPLGSERTVTMERPPLSEVSFLTGDGMRTAGPIVLQFELPGYTDQQIHAYRMNLEARVRTANMLGFGSRRRALLGNGWATWTTPDARHMSWTCTLTVYPSSPDGLDVDDSLIPF